MTICFKCSGTVPKPGEVFNWPPAECNCPPDPRNDPALLPVRRTDRAGERKFVTIAKLDAMNHAVTCYDALEAAKLALNDAMKKVRETP